MTIAISGNIYFARNQVVLWEAELHITNNPGTMTKSVILGYLDYVSM